MISLQNIPKCYNSFVSSNGLNTIKDEQQKIPLKLKVGSFVGAACGTIAAACLLAKHQSKVLNKPVNILNIKYNEFDIQAVALGSLGGGLLSGVALDDKKYTKAKVKEAIHQSIANIICPLMFIEAGHKLLNKINLKMPQFEPTSALKNFANKSLLILPGFVVTMAGLVSGVFVGTKISNYINKTENPEHQNRKVKLHDFIYHPDDVATALVLADKNGSIQKTVGKIIPPIFTLCGYETGTAR